MKLCGPRGVEFGSILINMLNLKFYVDPGLIILAFGMENVFFGSPVSQAAVKCRVDFKSGFDFPVSESTSLLM